MATSFRIPPEQLSRLNLLAKRLKLSKAQVVNRAIDLYYEEQIAKSKRSALDRLLESGFSPLPIDLGDLSSNEIKQREVISAKLRKKRSH